MQCLLFYVIILSYYKHVYFAPCNLTDVHKNVNTHKYNISTCIVSFPLCESG